MLGILVLRRFLMEILSLLGRQEGIPASPQYHHQFLSVICYPDVPNGLIIQRTSGPGRLYYSAYLNVIRPAVDVAPLNRGIETKPGISNQRPFDRSLMPSVGDLVLVRIALTLENDTHHLIVEDYIPAGAEILDTSLKTSQIGVDTCGTAGEACYSPCQHLLLRVGAGGCSKIP